MCASSNAARSRMPNTGAGLAVDDDRHAEKPRRRVPRREDLRPGVVAQGRDAQLMNSHGAGVLILTSAESPSTMCARPSDSGP
jgi:hypothetical protein